MSVVRSLPPLFPIHDRNQKPKRHKGHHVPHHIDQKQIVSNLAPVREIPVQLAKQFSIVLISGIGLIAAVFLTKKQIINKQDHIADKAKRQNIADQLFQSHHSYLNMLTITVVTTLLRIPISLIFYPLQS